jgi:hypothetical protein
MTFATTLRTFCALQILSLVLGASSMAVDAEKVRQAKEAFSAGVAAYQNKDWPEAERHFRESEAIAPHPLNAYMLSCIFVARNDPQTALKYANQALAEEKSSGLRLPDAERTSVDDIIGWAAGGGVVETHGKGDEVTAAGSPGASARRAPRPAVPADADHDLRADTPPPKEHMIMMRPDARIRERAVLPR